MTLHGLSQEDDDSFVIEAFRGYPLFHEEEIRGKRTTENVLRSMDTEDRQGPDVGRSDKYFESKARKKSEMPYSEDQVEKTLELAFSDHPLDEDADASLRNEVGKGENLIRKHSVLDGSIPLSIIENEKHGNPYQRDVVENELVESPFSDMDTGMSSGRKFRHKVV